ncbi:hypothetical protein BKA70DRAFT_1372187 [Coprinopsis sp. MPI-PUGE-AT-0042]|nr:hypothetical protein BKA70DRAFT_1372187 [Coprinopsis sp. MPI-PUGE-AT-0042]
MVLKNTSSVARDHLSSERTYLAYMRTSLGLCVMGVALVQLFAITEITDSPISPHMASQTQKLQQIARPLGALTVAFSFVVLLQGTWRYFRIQLSLFDNMFPIARISTALQTFVFTSIIVVIFVSMLSGN